MVVSGFFKRTGILLWSKNKYNPYDNLQLLGGWMRPMGFSFILFVDNDTAI